jgi:LuxR family quorum sensing-dependent transcriptional regulator
MRGNIMGQVAEMRQEALSPSFVDNLATVFDIKQILRATCEKYGFKHFMLAYIPHSENEKLSINSIAITNNWPTEVLGHYEMMGRTECEYLTKIARTRLAPNLEDVAGPKIDEAHAELLARYKFYRNGYFPVNNNDGVHLLVLTGSTDIMLSDEHLADIQLFATRLVEKSLKIIPSDTMVDTNISQRENEVLQWIAEGKTSAEIATIMSLSEHTVNHYAMLAVQKLECVNRTQAVVRSMRLGLIR